MNESILISKNLEKCDQGTLKKKKKDFKKRLVLLPHIFTFGNCFFGFCSIILSARGDLFAAASFILLGALMDALDGRIARIVGVSSDLGVQLDSLGDAISFCLAPALLVYCWQLKHLGFLGVFFSAVFLITGIFRLAKFNIIYAKQAFFFIGLPTTVAGCFLSIFLLNFLDVDRVDNNEWFLFFVVILVLLLSFLMISSIRFPSFKKRLFNLNKSWYIVLFVITLAVFYVMQFAKFLLLLFFLYFLSALVCAIKFKDEGDKVVESKI